MKNSTFEILDIIDSIKNWSYDCPFKIELKRKISEK